MQDNVKRLFAGMLLLPVLMLMACASNSPQPTSALPQLPKKPSLTTPVPSQSYSVSAQQDMQRWQKRLMDTPLMQCCSMKPGQAKTTTERATE